MKTIKDFPEWKYGTIHENEFRRVIYLNSCIVVFSKNYSTFYVWKYLYHPNTYTSGNDVTPKLIENFEYVSFLESVISSMENGDIFRKFRKDEVIEIKASEIQSLKEFLKNFKES